MQSERSLEEEFLPPFQESGLEKLSPGRDGLSWILKLDYEFLMQKQQKIEKKKGGGNHMFIPVINIAEFWVFW